MVVGTREWKLIPAVRDLAKDAPIVAKDSYDAFRSGQLETILKEQCAERLIVTGVMTDICCHTTAVQAFTKNYETWLVTDACGTSTEEQHEGALKSAKLLIENVLDTAEAIRRLETELYTC